MGTLFQNDWLRFSGVEVGVRPDYPNEALWFGPCTKNLKQCEDPQCLYWQVACTIDLPKGSSHLWLAVDRHYELCIDGESVVHVCNYHQGADHVAVQCFCVESIEQRSLEFKLHVRSDFEQRKNHLPYIAGVAGFLISPGQASLPVEAWSNPSVSYDRRPRHTYDEDNKPLLFELITVGASTQKRSDAEDILELQCQPVETEAWFHVPLPRVVSRDSFTGAWLLDTILPENCYAVNLSQHALPNDEEICLKLQVEAAQLAKSMWFFPKAMAFRLTVNDKAVFKSTETEDMGGQDAYRFLLPFGIWPSGKKSNTLCLWIAVPRDIMGKVTKRTFRFGLASADGQSITVKGDDRLQVESLLLGESLASAYVSCARSIQGAGLTTCSVGQRIRLDTGRMQWGRCRGKLHTETLARIAIQYGFQQERGALDAFRMGLDMRDDVVLDGVSTFVNFEPRPFRFVDIIALDHPIALDPNGWFFEEQNYLGLTRPAHCSDAAIERIWNMAERTAHCCTEAIYMDNSEREHTQWIDNAAPLIAVGCWRYGDYERASAFLFRYLQTQMKNAEYPGYFPGSWAGRKPLQCHQALLILAVVRYFEWTGDLDFASRAWPHLILLLDHFRSHRDGQGLLKDIDVCFFDWGVQFYSYERYWTEKESIRSGRLCAINAYFVGILRAVARLREATDKESARLLRSEADETASAIMSAFYRPEVGLLVDGIENYDAEERFSEVSQTLFAWLVKPGGEEAGEMLDQMLRANHVVPASAHFLFQWLSAFFENDRGAIALDVLKQRFQAHFEADAQTVWESWCATASTCQGTGAAPAYILAKYLSGVVPQSPGFSSVLLKPQTCGLNSFAADITLPAGLVRVAWDMSNKTYQAVFPASMKGVPIALDTSIFSESQCSISYEK